MQIEAQVDSEQCCRNGLKVPAKRLRKIASLCNGGIQSSSAIWKSADGKGPFLGQMLINCCFCESPPVSLIAQNARHPLTRLNCMYLRFAKRLLLETDKRLLFKLAYLAGFKGLRSVQKHKSRLKRGEFFPPFLYISIINTCNLRCQGCWVDVAAKQTKIDFAAMNKTLTEAKAMGNSFFGILGGEPFMHKELLDILAAHPDAYFQVFTNGHFITDEVAKRLRQLGNVTPLISVEGSQIVSDARRGRDGVLSKTMEGLQNCLNNKVMTGVCTSVCKSNIDDSLNDAWVDRLVEMGVMYCWFHVFRVVGPESSPELALDTAELARVREFVVSTRVKKPIIVIDAYHDGKGRALCPAVTGFTHHIGPGGHIEPCPIIQLAKESIHDGRPLKEVFQQSEFLRDFRETVSKHTRGCVVLERPDFCLLYTSPSPRDS